MNEVIQTILARKGTKVYKSDPVPRKDLELLAKVGIAAPNAYNAQEWHFSFVTNATLLNELEKQVYQALLTCGISKPGGNQHPLYEAPVLVVISADRNSAFAKQDCSAANENIAIAAKSLGFGSRFLDVPNHFFNAPGGETYKKRCGVPDGYDTICFLALGYPADSGEVATEKKNDVVSFIE